jgi:hypothetical protein
MNEESGGVKKVYYRKKDEQRSMKGYIFVYDGN